MQINAETNIHQVLAEIERINQKGGNLSQLMQDIGSTLDSITTQALDNEASPDGTPWQPLKADTLKRKKQSRTLYESGDLQTIEVESDHNSVTIGTNAHADKSGYAYPAVHQFGSKDGHTPPRAFLPFEQGGDLMDVAADSILNTVYEYFAG